MFSNTIKASAPDAAYAYGKASYNQPGSFMFDTTPMDWKSAGIHISASDITVMHRPSRYCECALSLG